MPDPLRLSEIRFKPVRDDAAGPGLIGFVSCILDDTLRVDGIMLRETRAGRTTLSWPSRRDRAGREHSIVAPLDEPARRRLEEQLFRALNVDPGERP